MIATMCTQVETTHSPICGNSFFRDLCKAQCKILSSFYIYVSKETIVCQEMEDTQNSRSV